MILMVQKLTQFVMDEVVSVCVSRELCSRIVECVKSIIMDSLLALDAQVNQSRETCVLNLTEQALYAHPVADNMQTTIEYRWVNLQSYK